MEDLRKEADETRRDLVIALRTIKIDLLASQLSQLERESQKAGFWEDSAHAQSVMKQISKLKDRVVPWEDLRESVDEVTGLLELDDASMKDELKTQLHKIKTDFQAL